MDPNFNRTEFSLYFGSMFPVPYLNLSLDYDSIQKLNATVQTLINNGELYGWLYKNATFAPKRDPMYLAIPITILYTLILVSGIIGNVSTCIVIVRNKSMHTATNYYLFSLAISDLLLLLCGLPIEIHRIWHPDVYIFGETCCRILGLCSETSANATVLTITAFTVERYIAICHPFLSHTMSKLSRVIKFIIAVWVVALCLAIPQAIQFGVIYEFEDARIVSACNVKWEFIEHAFEISGFVFFVGPMTAITVLYILIGIKLKTSRLLRPPKKSSQNSHQEQNGSAKSYKNGVSQSRAIKMLVAVAVSFFICWAPFHAQRLLAIYGKNAEKTSVYFLQVYKTLTYLSGILYYLSTTINPFLYNIMSNKFREAFKNTIAHRCCGRNRRSTNQTKTGSKAHHRVNRPRYPSIESRHTTSNSMTKKTSAEGNNHAKKRKRNDDNFTVKLSLMEAEKNHEVSSGLLNSITGRLYRSTRSVFRPKVDDLDSSVQSAGYSSRRIQCGSTESGRSHSISNSSLQDLEGEEFTGKELVTFMEQVNNNIYQ